MESFNKLGDKIKEYEKAFNTCLTTGCILIVRLDGCSFKTFTKGLLKPFDERLTNSIIRTTESLVEKFHACLGFCQSDEISLVINTNRKGRPVSDISMLYGGRIQKLCSIIGSFCSVKFNGFIQGEDWRDVSEKTKEKLMGFNAIFDCRVFSVPDEKAAMEAIYWRHHYDCRRNAINCIGFANFSSKHLHNVSVRKLIENLKKEKNIDILNDFNHFNIFGCFTKKIIVPYNGTDPLTLKKVECMRTKVQSRSLNMTENEIDMIKLVMANTWNELENNGENELIEKTDD